MPAYQVERSIAVSAPPSRVFSVVADFNTWSTWSPWLIADPGASVRVSGPPGSVGSGYAWCGDVSGAGEMEFRKVERDRRLEIELRFLKPFKSRANVEFELQPSPAGAVLTWRMSGSLPWFLFWMIPMLKTFVGQDYHRGLLMVKDWIETGKIESKTTPHGITPVGPLRMFGVRASAHLEEVGSIAPPAMDRCEQLFRKHGLPVTGEGIAVYHRLAVKTGRLDFIIGHLVPDSATLPTGAELAEWRLPAVRAFRVEFEGVHHHLGNGWSVANQITRHRKLKQSNAGAFELYRPLAPGAALANRTVDIFLPLKG
ncbi:MAG: SRPBCC family protein [Opitutaceae bacterium]